MADNEVTADEIEKELRKAISYIAGQDLMSVDASTSFKELGVDSMMAIEVMAAMEKQFNIQIQEKDVIKFTSLKNTVNTLLGYLK